MKKIILALAILAINNQALFAQTNNSAPVDSAMIYLSGTFKKYNPSKAFAIYRQHATNGDAKAMNALALLYTKGLGVDSNFSNAVYWYTQAIANGYTKALVNLGMLHKSKATDSLGYAKAVGYYNTALQANEPSAFFAQGYMYYKGLGCTQSYTNAHQLFKQGATIKRPDCIYFIGLCYKYGYGLASNTDSADKYFNYAAALGYTQANNYLAITDTVVATGQRTAARQNSNNPNFNKPQLQTIEENITAYNPYAKITKQAKSPLFIGSYEGILNQYDYSGTQLLAQITVTIALTKANDNSLFGELILGNQPPIKLKAIQQGNQLICSNTNIVTATNNKKNKEILAIKNATFETNQKGDTNFLTGSLQLFNNRSKEPDKPINLLLKQKATTTANTAVDEGRLSVFPNPASSTITIAFNNPHNTAIKLLIYNSVGRLVFIKIIENAILGNNHLQVNASDFATGIYTVKLQSKGDTKTTLFIKD